MKINPTSLKGGKNSGSRGPKSIYAMSKGLGAKGVKVGKLVEPGKPIPRTPAFDAGYKAGLAAAKKKAK